MSDHGWLRLVIALGLAIFLWYVVAWLADRHLNNVTRHRKEDL